MTKKAKNIFDATRHDIYSVLKGHNINLTDRWRMAGWSYGKTPEGQQFMSQRTLNDVRKLVEREEHRLDMNDKYGISLRDPEWAADQREVVRVLKDMVEDTQEELDHEKQERADRKRMSYDEWIAKYYPQFA